MVSRPGGRLLSSGRPTGVNGHVDLVVWMDGTKRCVCERSCQAQVRACCNLLAGPTALTLRCVARDALTERCWWASQASRTGRRSWRCEMIRHTFQGWGLGVLGWSEPASHFLAHIGSHSKLAGPSPAPAAQTHRGIHSRVRI